MAGEPARSSEMLLPPSTTAAWENTRVVALLGVAADSKNRGVQALGVSLIQLVTQTRPEAQVVLLSNHHRAEVLSLPRESRRNEVCVVPARLSPRSRLSDHLAVIVIAAALHRSIPLASLRRAICRRLPWAWYASEAAIVGDIRGGDSFSDIYGLRRFLIGFLMAWSVNLVRGEIVQLAQ